MKAPFNQKCFYVVAVLFLITCGLLWFSHGQYEKSRRLIEEVEYYDSLNNYNYIYYSKKFASLKGENKALYDSLKHYKSQIDYIVQFYHEKEYNTGHVTTKPIIKDSIIHDTVPLIVPQIAKTYEYTSEPNDTFLYKVNINSFTEPLWYSLEAKVKNKFTIVNKEENGINHVTIGSENGGTISNTTVFKNDRGKTFLDRLAIGPSVTVGYDVCNKNIGVMVGVSATYDLTKK